MLTFTSKKKILIIGTMFSAILLISTLYVTSPTNTSYTPIQNLNFYYKNNHTHVSTNRIFCLILTTPKHLLTRAKAINETWAPRCGRYFFVTEYSPSSMSQEQINFTQQVPIAPFQGITPGYDHLTQKSTLAFHYAYEQFFNDTDWFVKADDDTYLFVDNLKRFLKEQNTYLPITFGYNFKVN